jgi:hypothetical protein
MDCNPSAHSTGDNGQCTSFKIPSGNYGELEVPPSSSNDTNSGEGVINGQDMTLLQRPLLESPSGSDSSKGDDSIDENLQSDDVGVTDEQNRDRELILGPDCSEAGANGHEVEVAGEQALSSFEMPSSADKASKELGIAHETGSGLSTHGKHHSMESLGFDVNIKSNPSNISEDQAEPTYVGEKRDRPKYNGIPSTDESTSKKIRQESGFGTNLSISGDSTVDVSRSPPSLDREFVPKQFSPYQQKLGDGIGVTSKLAERSTFSEFEKSAIPDTLTSSPGPIARPEVQNLSPGIFDDAEEDDTFVLKSLGEPSKKTSSPEHSVRPDLVAAILGSPSKHNLPPLSVAAPAPTIAAVPVVSRENKSKNADGNKTKAPRPVKKVWIAKKEQDSAIAKFRGKIDLQRVLTKEDSAFLGKYCFLFTLQQLEYVLDEDEAAQDADLKQKLRRRVVDKVKDHKFLVSP